MTQSEIITEALTAMNITPHQLNKLMAEKMGWKNSTRGYSLATGKRTTVHPETITALAELLSIDPDRLYIAAGTIPPDVQNTLVEYPQLLQVVRNLRTRLSSQ